MTMTEPDFSNVPAPSTMPHGAHATPQDDRPVVTGEPTLPTAAPVRTVADFQENPNAIVVGAGKKKVIPHNLVFVDMPYKVLPIKKLQAIEFGSRIQAAGEDFQLIMNELRVAVNQIFGKTVGPQVMERLVDPEDGADLEDVMDLIKVLAERATGNPTS